MLGAELSLLRNDGCGADLKEEGPQKKRLRDVLAVNQKYSVVVERMMLASLSFHFR